MKKIAVILFVITLPLLAQSNKGKISLMYNEEKFDLPITQIVIRKENNVLVSIRAERSDSSGLQSISLEFPIDNMAVDPKISTDNLRLLISSQERKDAYGNGNRFIFNYGPKDAIIEIYYKNEKLNWSSPSFQFRFDKIEITHSREGLKIKGSFSGKYISTPQGIQPKTMAEIKDGKFEIIL